MADEEVKPTEEAAPEQTAAEAEEQPTEAVQSPEEQSTEPEKPEEEPKEEAKDEEKALETLKDKGFDFDELKKEYLENGDLSEETRNKLHDIGFTDEFINDFIEGKKAQAQIENEKLIGELSETVGGREKYNEIIDWASKNLDKEEISAINEVHDKTAMKFLLAGLKSRMENKEGSIPQQIQGGGAATADDVFESQAQMFEAIRDPRYKKDPAYVAKVTAKIRASRAAGINLGV